MKWFVILLLLSGCGSVSKPEPEEQDKQLNDKVIVTEDDDIYIPPLANHIYLLPNELMFYCSSLPSECNNTYQATHVINHTPRVEAVYKPYIMMLDGPGQVNSFVITSQYDWPVSVQPGDRLKIDVMFYWNTYQQNGTLFIPLSQETLECNLSGKLMIF